MFKAIRRWWKYQSKKAERAVDERADPEVQIDQAIDEFRTRDRQLREQAANVIAAQKRNERHLETALENRERAEKNAQQALMMLDEATANGDTAAQVKYESAAKSFGLKLVTIEEEVERLKVDLLHSTQNADKAKAAVRQNSMLMEQTLARKRGLMSKLEQAKMQEKINDAMAIVNDTVGDDVPTFEEIEQKIEARYAKAAGRGEIAAINVNSEALEVEQSVLDTQAEARLRSLRAKLGRSGGKAAELEVDSAPELEPVVDPATETA